MQSLSTSVSERSAPAPKTTTYGIARLWVPSALITAPVSLVGGKAIRSFVTVAKLRKGKSFPSPRIVGSAEISRVQCSGSAYSGPVGNNGSEPDLQSPDCRLQGLPSGGGSHCALYRMNIVHPTS